jgi:hypothetical protein
MRANTECLAAKVQTVQVGWGDLRAWAKRVFTSEATECLLLTSAIVAMFGTIVFSFHKAMQVSASTGLGITSFGVF